MADILLRKARVFWPLALLLLLTDCSTKRWASVNLTEHVPEPVLGDVVRFQLAHNPGAAMGITLGAYSRIGFALLTLVALVMLFRLYRSAAGSDVRLAAATALVTGGALGNLIDRLRWERGVVDFIDIGVGATRFWTFNVADVGVVVGSVSLAVLLWRGQRPTERPATS